VSTFFLAFFPAHLFSSPDLRKCFEMPERERSSLECMHLMLCSLHAGTSTGQQGGIANPHQGACVYRNMKLTIQVCCETTTRKLLPSSLLPNRPTLDARAMDLTTRLASDPPTGGDPRAELPSSAVSQMPAIIRLMNEQRYPICRETDNCRAKRFISRCLAIAVNAG
jgi:hypothetical protein